MRRRRGLISTVIAGDSSDVRRCVANRVRSSLDISGAQCHCTELGVLTQAQQMMVAAGKIAAAAVPGQRSATARRSGSPDDGKPAGSASHCVTHDGQRGNQRDSVQQQGAQHARVKRAGQDFFHQAADTAGAAEPDRPHQPDGVLPQRRAPSGPRRDPPAAQGTIGLNEIAASIRNWVEAGSWSALLETSARTRQHLGQPADARSSQQRGVSAR